MRTLAALALCLLIGCGVDRPQAALLIWVPGGGPPAARIRELVAEMGLSATFLEDRQALSMNARALQGVRAAVCFDGPGGEALPSSALATLPGQGGILLAAGQAMAALGPAWGFRARGAEDPALFWAPALWHRLPPGTFQSQDGLAVVYGYGQKDLSGWEMETKTGEIWARGRQGQARWLEQETPRGGRLVLAGLPLAAEAALGDSFQARLLLERAAELARQPRLWPTPEGKGSLLVNIHVDSKLHIHYLPELLARWPRQLKGSFHFTAGPDCDREGDRLGFNAWDPTQGGQWVERFAPLGEVGSHGGWIHNVWALNGPQIPLAHREELLLLNFAALAPWGAGTSYSSPGGFHPRDINPWLEAHGVRAYYHTGEAGCPPTRAWFNGSPLSKSMWAFPIATLGASAATYEFKQNGVSEAEAGAWFQALTEYCCQHRETRMIYGHAPDFADMPAAYGSLLGSLSTALAADRLRSYTMTEYTAFQERRRQVQWSLLTQCQARLLKARGPLQGMAFQVPGAWQLGAPDPGLVLTRENDITWIVIKDLRDHLEVNLWPWFGAVS